MTDDRYGKPARDSVKGSGWTQADENELRSLKAQSKRTEDEEARLTELEAKKERYR